MREVENKKITLRGTVQVPGDKSITHRAIMLASLAEGPSAISGYLASEDCKQTLAAFQSLGVSVKVEVQNGSPTLCIEGKGLHGLSEAKQVIDCGNSGTTLRLLSGLLAGQPFFSVLTGDASLRNRPMRRLVDPLRRMGAKISGRAGGGYAPLAISGGGLCGIDYDLPVASAQMKSALLLAGLFAKGKTTLTEPLVSRDHTERMLRFFGARFSQEAGRLCLEGEGSLQGQVLTVPGDLSSAAFFLVAGAIVNDSEISLPQVGVNPTRTGILDILKAMGARITVSQVLSSGIEPVADLTVLASPLHGITIDGELLLRAIDEFPIVCVAAAVAEGETVIRGAHELRVKESDRIAVMAKALLGMGVPVEVFPDGMKILGCKRLRGTFCETRGDHRIAMALSVAGLVTAGANQIDDTACIETSFPGFGELLFSLIKES